jgi:hypothetical protein
MKSRALIPTVTLTLLLLTAVLLHPAPATEMALDYVARYDHVAGVPDHLMDVLALSDGRAIVSGNLGLALVDLGALPPGGANLALYRLNNVNGRDLYTADEHYFYVNLNRGSTGQSPGFAVIELVGDTLKYVTTVDETDVMYEKMCIRDGYLFVAAHSYGLRIFTLADPAAPTLVGSLETGLDDAWAVAVAGDTAFVADGVGGFKLVDVSDETTPWLLGGEDPLTSAGTSESVTLRNGHAYVAAGGAGVAFYANGNPATRTIYPVDGAAEDLAWSGDHLVVSDFSSILVFEADVSGALIRVGEETTHRRDNGILRLAEGVDATAGGLVLGADWNYMDIYQLRPVIESVQPDIDADLQRLRFAPEGGNAEVVITNSGGANLVIGSVTVSHTAFACDYAGGTLTPGESITCVISYDGSPGEAEGGVLFYSNDPDENPLPVQVFGRTSYLDPGEPAIDFTLPRWDHDGFGGWASESFTLSDHIGKIVWFTVYGYW